MWTLLLTSQQKNEKLKMTHKKIKQEKNLEGEFA